MTQSLTKRFADYLHSVCLYLFSNGFFQFGLDFNRRNIHAHAPHVMLFSVGRHICTGLSVPSPHILLLSASHTLSPPLPPSPLLPLSPSHIRLFVPCCLMWRLRHTSPPLSEWYRYIYRYYNYIYIFSRHKIAENHTIVKECRLRI